MTAIRPIETDSTPVEVHGAGQEPQNILWRGRQWAVTDFGLEALNGSYAIDEKGLRLDFAEWSVLMQMGEKTWIDMPDFTTAFMVAIVLHGHAPGFDRAQIMGDFQKGMKLQDRRG